MNQSDHTDPHAMTITGHLEELRIRFFIVITTFFLASVIGFFFAPWLIDVLTQPIRSLSSSQSEASCLVLKLQPDGRLLPTLSDGSEFNAKNLSHMRKDSLMMEVPWTSQTISLGNITRTPNNLYYLSPTDPFMLLLKASFLLGGIIGIPVFLWQAWLFIAPGLLKRERAVAKPVLVCSVILFPIGAAFAWYTIRFALQFLIGLSDQLPGIEPNLVVSQYISFALTLMIVAGIFFELPLILVILAQLGLVSSKMLSKYHRHTIVVLAICSVVFTPPDPASMIIMLTPLVLLFEISLWIVRLVERKQPQAENN